MPWVAPIVGFVDRLGYLRCRPCTERLDTGRDHPVYADVGPHNEQPCDTCGRRLIDTVPTDKVLVT